MACAIVHRNDLLRPVRQASRGETPSRWRCRHASEGPNEPSDSLALATGHVAHNPAVWAALEPPTRPRCEDLSLTSDSLQRLTRTLYTRICGLFERRDCFPCLRPDTPKHLRRAYAQVAVGCRITENLDDSGNR